MSTSNGFKGEDGPEALQTCRTRIVCPACQSPRFERVPRSTYRESIFLIRAPSRCKDCGECFPTPCSLAVCVLTVVLGIVCVVIAFAFYIAPTVKAIIGGHVSVIGVIDLLGGLCVGILSVIMMIVGVRTAVYSAGFRKQGEEKRDRSD